MPDSRALDREDERGQREVLEVPGHDVVVEPAEGEEDGEEAVEGEQEAKECEWERREEIGGGEAVGWVERPWWEELEGWKVEWHRGRCRARAE